MRHAFTVADLKTPAEVLELKVLVIGDVIVDDYITCDR
jgi:bifunctional ADP-heptose synthase (sugar kinase/adenylyltransferase)